MAASVSTLVVSWKDDAQMNDSVDRAGLGDAEQQRLGDAGLAAALEDPLVLLLEQVLFDLLVDEEVRVAHVLDRARGGASGAR